MEMTGPCHVCGKPATRSCTMCGSITCDKHLKKGVCVECRGGEFGGEDSGVDISSEDVYS